MTTSSSPRKLEDHKNKFRQIISHWTNIIYFSVSNNFIGCCSFTFDQPLVLMTACEKLWLEKKKSDNSNTTTPELRLISCRSSEKIIKKGVRRTNNTVLFPHFMDYSPVRNHQLFYFFFLVKPGKANTHITIVVLHYNLMEKQMFIIKTHDPLQIPRNDNCVKVDKFNFKGPVYPSR